MSDPAPPGGGAGATRRRTRRPDEYRCLAGGIRCRRRAVAGASRPGRGGGRAMAGRAHSLPRGRRVTRSLYVHWLWRRRHRSRARGARDRSRLARVMAGALPRLEQAQRYFGGETTWSQAWAGGLEQRDDGLWPAFEIDLMVDALEEVSRTSYWDAWGAVRCPILIVRAAGGDGWADYQRMVELQPSAAGRDRRRRARRPSRPATSLAGSARALPHPDPARPLRRPSAAYGWVPPSLCCCRCPSAGHPTSGETRTRG